MPSQRERSIPPALFLFSFSIFLLAWIVLDGFTLYFLKLPADPWLILALAALELIVLLRAVGRPRFDPKQDALELAGFLLIVTGVWIYLVAPAWPTLLPPSSSGDAANHAAFVQTIYTTRTLFPSYPAGPALMVATLANWIGWEPLRLLHLTGSLFLALTAGGVYGIACGMLPRRREYQIVALGGAGALFATWGYFAGMLVGHDYFFTQAAAQMFIVAVVWFVARFLESHRQVWLVGIALCLIAIGVSWQLWLFLPFAIFAWSLFLEWRAGRLSFRQGARAFLAVAGSLALFAGLVVITSPELIPLRSIGRIYVSTGSILEPSFEALGGFYLILPALGVLVLRGSGYQSRAATAFLGWGLVQTLVLLTWHQFGLSGYFTDKTFYLLVLPMALFAVAPLARGMEIAQRYIPRRIWASPAMFGLAVFVLAVWVFFFQPDASRPVLAESDVQVALWARDHLPTTNVHMLGRKSLLANWIGVALWGEKYPSDLFVDLAALGPKTFEEWRENPDWGDYLFSPSGQRTPDDPTLLVLFEKGESAVLARPATPPLDASGPAIARFGKVLELQDMDLPDETLDPGETVTVTTQVRVLGIPSEELVWRPQLRDPDNNLIAESRVAPFDGEFPLQRWPIGREITQTFTLVIPADTDPGLYHLQLGLYSVQRPEAMPVDPMNTPSPDVVQIASIKVPLPQLEGRELASITRTGASFGAWTALLGFRLDPGTAVRPGQDLQVRLYWRGRRPVQVDYHVFVHLIDSGGRVRAQRDGPPLDGNYPTSIWDPGEIVVDMVTISVPPDLPPGSYRLEVGMYGWPDLVRLPVTDERGASLGDRFILPANVSVTGNSR